MIKFFRHIRQRMLKENRASKYLLYAIGEIILVVIGILIALQINNWNETRKLRVTEVALLTELRTNLDATMLLFQADTTFNALSLAHLRRIDEYIANDRPHEAALDTSFSYFTNWASPYPILTGYKTLQTKGIDLIANDVLRNSIVNLYEFEFPILNEDYDQSEWNTQQAIVFPMYVKTIWKDPLNTRIARPNDFEALKHDETFKNTLSFISALRRSGIGRYRNTMMKINEVIQEIDVELESRSE